MESRRNGRRSAAEEEAPGRHREGGHRLKGRRIVGACSASPYRSRCRSYSQARVAAVILVRYGTRHTATATVPALLHSLEARYYARLGRLKDFDRAADRPRRDSLAGLSPTDFLRATWREGEGPFEQRLLDVSDRSYGLIIATLQERFAPRPSGQPRWLSPRWKPWMRSTAFLSSAACCPHSLCRERRGHGRSPRLPRRSPRAAGFSAFSCRVLTGACPADLWPSLWTPG